MTETCFVTQVRLLAALDAANTAAAAAVKKQLPPRASSFFSSIPWPFLPQVACPGGAAALTTTKASPKESVILTGSSLRQRKLVAATAVSAALAPLQKLHSKVQDSPLNSANFSLPAVVLLVLKGLRAHLAESVLGAAVVSALLLLVAEGVTCLISLILAAKLPAGLFFMVAALGLMGFVAAQAILHDSASIQRRKSSRALLNR